MGIATMIGVAGDTILWTKMNFVLFYAPWDKHHHHRVMETAVAARRRKTDPAGMTAGIGGRKEKPERRTHGVLTKTRLRLRKSIHVPRLHTVTVLNRKVNLNPHRPVMMNTLGNRAAVPVGAHAVLGVLGMVAWHHEITNMVTVVNARRMLTPGQIAIYGIKPMAR
jgi:hypothetical protein